MHTGHLHSVVKRLLSLRVTGQRHLAHLHKHRHGILIALLSAADNVFHRLLKVALAVHGRLTDHECRSASLNQLLTQISHNLPVRPTPGLRPLANLCKPSKSAGVTGQDALRE